MWCRNAEEGVVMKGRRWHVHGVREDKGVWSDGICRRRHERRVIKVCVY